VPVPGDQPICANCGLDFRYVNAQSWASGPAAPQYGAPQFGAPLAAQAPKSRMPIVLLGVGLAVVLAAGAGFLYVQSQKSSDASASPSVAASEIAEATPTAEATETDESPGPDVWATYNSEDGKWGVKFPGTADPITQTQTLGSGVFTGDATAYAVASSFSVVYMVMTVKFDSSLLSGMSAKTFYDTFQVGMAEGMEGEVVSSSDTMVGTHPARDILVEGSDWTFDMRLVSVGGDLYVVGVYSEGTDKGFPGYFKSTFALK
jgi:hypothetical protein